MMKSCVVGVFSSICATVIICIFSKWMHPRWKSRFLFRLNRVRYILYRIDTHAMYDEYSELIRCVELVQDQYFELVSNLYPLSMLLEKQHKQLIYTLLFDGKERTERILYFSEGFSGDDERKSRIQRFKRDNYDSGNNFLPLVQLDLVEMLVTGKRIDCRHIFPAMVKIQETYEQIDWENIIHCGSFKQVNDSNPQRAKGIEQKEFKKIVKYFQKIICK